MLYILERKLTFFLLSSLLFSADRDFVTIIPFILLVKSSMTSAIPVKWLQHFHTSQLHFIPSGERKCSSRWVPGVSYKHFCLVVQWGMRGLLGSYRMGDAEQLKHVKSPLVKWKHTCSNGWALWDWSTLRKEILILKGNKSQ